MVVFGDPMGVALALKAAEEQLVVEWRVPESEEPIGVKGRWMRGRHSEHPNIFFGSLSQHVQQVTLYYTELHGITRHSTKRATLY